MGQNNFGIFVEGSSSNHNIAVSLHKYLGCSCLIGCSKSPYRCFEMIRIAEKEKDHSVQKFEDV